jgi:hypothetical protein
MSSHRAQEQLYLHTGSQLEIGKLIGMCEEILRSNMAFNCRFVLCLLNFNGSSLFNILHKLRVANIYVSLRLLTVNKIKLFQTESLFFFVEETTSFATADSR